MSLLVTKERAVREVTQFEANGRFERAFGSAAAGETIDFVPSGMAAGHLLRVLIVDDHRATADTLSSLVTVWGHDARCAYDGVSGVRLAAAFQPDVMLLDILMPTVSGLDVAVQVRRQDPLKHCFIVAVTGRTDVSHRSRCYEAGADLVLIKPVVPSHMQTLLLLELQHVRSRNNSNRQRFVTLN
jgi:DNA-binding response OmpR family regulator